MANPQCKCSADEYCVRPLWCLFEYLGRAAVPFQSRKRYETNGPSLLDSTLKMMKISLELPSDNSDDKHLVGTRSDSYRWHTYEMQVVTIPFSHQFCCNVMMICDLLRWRIPDSQLCVLCAGIFTMTCLATWVTIATRPFCPWRLVEVFLCRCWS